MQQIGAFFIGVWNEFYRLSISRCILGTCFLARELALFQEIVDDAGSLDGKKDDFRVAQSAKDDSATVPPATSPF